MHDTHAIIVGAVFGRLFDILSMDAGVAQSRVPNGSGVRKMLNC